MSAKRYVYTVKIAFVLAYTAVILKIRISILVKLPIIIKRQRCIHPEITTFTVITAWIKASGGTTFAQPLQCLAWSDLIPEGVRDHCYTRRGGCMQ